MSELRKELARKASLIKIDLSEKQLDQFEHFYEMLIETNKVMNLTAITEWHEVVEKHFIDSILLDAVWTPDDSASLRMIDVGTGAGFPGIPLKIIHPDWQIILLDSLQKRLSFLDRVIEECGLENIQTVHGRAEDLGRNPEHRDQYDLAVSRAVARLEVLTELCSPFVKKGGLFVSYKSGKIEEECENAKKAIFVLSCQMEKVKTITLPESDVERSFVFLRKKDVTPKKYPRKAGTPAKTPIIG